MIGHTTHYCHRFNSIPTKYIYWIREWMSVNVDYETFYPFELENSFSSKSQNGGLKNLCLGKIEARLVKGLTLTLKIGQWNGHSMISGPIYILVTGYNCK